MHAIASHISTFLSTKFGRCARCMRLALRLAIIAWLLLLLAGLTTPNITVWYLTLAAAIGLTMLCVAHFIAHGLHRVTGAQSGKQGVRPMRPAAIRPVGKGRSAIPLTLSRRETLMLFLRGMAAAAMATLPTFRPAAAGCGDCANQHGAGYYDCITNFCSTDGQVCCPPGAPYLSHCDCLCYETSNTGCNSYSNCLYCG